MIQVIQIVSLPQLMFLEAVVITTLSHYLIWQGLLRKELHLVLILSFQNLKLCIDVPQRGLQIYSITSLILDSSCVLLEYIRHDIDELYSVY